ncbi:hypothetical protein [Bacillus paranthracis]|uniref:hypothetical protein n=1 Tax=Bacillus paranthracis TaxID=2026186 RepID=UPI002FDBFF6B|nr:hypothetical protein [Bacillus paranthracis]
MKSVIENGKKYFVELNYKGESPIYNENKVKINHEISTDLYYRILLKAKENSEEKIETLTYEMSSVNVYKKGDLKGYVDGFITFKYENNESTHEFLYRYDDIENGKNFTLVTIDYGYTVPGIDNIFEKIENDLKGIVLTEQLKSTYPLHLIETVRRSLGLDKDDTSMDNTILEMDKSEVFAGVVQWNGLLGGYDVTIKDWIKDIYGIDLDDIDKK